MIDRRQRAAWAGMIGPALFVTIFTVEGWLRPGYQPRKMFVSELALGPRGWIQRVNFVVFGMLSLGFARGIAAAFRGGKASRGGPILLRIIGVSLIASGIFVMDPATTPRDRQSWHGRLHNLFGATVFSLMPTTCFVFLRRFRDDPTWRSPRGLTLAAGVTSVAGVVAMSAARNEPPSEPNALNQWIGALQRTALVPYLIWQFIVALALLRRSTRGRA